MSRRRLGQLRSDPSRCTVRSRAKPVLQLDDGRVQTFARLFDSSAAARVEPRDRLLAEVWGYHHKVETRTIDTRVQRLRRKLGRAGDRHRDDPRGLAVTRFRREVSALWELGRINGIDSEMAGRRERTSAGVANRRPFMGGSGRSAGRPGRIGIQSSKGLLDPP